MKVITAIEADWDLALTTWHCIETTKENRTASLSQGWDDTTVNCSRLPKYFMAQVLVASDTSPSDRFSQSLLDTVDAHDSNGVRRLFYLHSMGGANMYVPKVARSSKALSLEIYKERIHSVNGIRDWCKTHISSIGHIDWLRGGPYTIEWDENGVASKIRFWLGDVATATVKVTRDFTLVDAWDPWVAELRAPSGPGRYKLNEFFTKDPPTGPHKFALDRKGVMMTSFAEKVQKTREEREKEWAERQVKYDNEDENFVGGAREQKKKEALAKASAQAAAGAKRRRVMKLAP